MAPMAPKFYDAQKASLSLPGHMGSSSATADLLSHRSRAVKEGFHEINGILMVF